MNNKKYFIAENDEQKGPFSYNELQEMRISRTTLIWKEGLDDWTAAGKIQQLQSLLKITPPKLPQNQEKKKKKDNTLNVNLGIVTTKTKIQLKEKELAKAKLKSSFAKNTVYYTKRILISIFIIAILVFINYQVQSTIPQYNNGLETDDFRQFVEISNLTFYITLCICFFIIFGKSLSQTFGWFKKHSEKEL